MGVPHLSAIDSWFQVYSCLGTWDWRTMYMIEYMIRYSISIFNLANQFVFDKIRYSNTN